MRMPPIDVRILSALSAAQLLLPVPALAAPRIGSSPTFNSLVHFFLAYINILIPIAIAAAVVLYMYNTASGIFKLRSGSVDPDWQKGMIWGIVAIFLMVSLWGILTILANTFGVAVMTG